MDSSKYGCVSNMKFWRVLQLKSASVLRAQLSSLSWRDSKARTRRFDSASVEDKCTFAVKFYLDL